MKRLFLLALLTTSFLNAQKNWTIELGIGNHTIADEYQDLRDNFYHLDAVARYSFNEKFGVGVYGGFDRLSLEHYITKAPSTTNLYRASLEGVVDILEVTDLSNDFFTVLGHGGFGVTRFSNGVNEFSRFNPNISGGFTALAKLSKMFALKLDWTTTSNFNQGKDLSGGSKVTNVGINSFLGNATVGLTFYPGRRSKEHYDWYVAPEDTRLSEMAESISSLEQDVAKLPTTLPPPTVVNAECDCLYGEYVYFDFDDYEVHRSELSAIESIVEKADGRDLRLVGYACPRFGTVKYNKKLAKERVDSVKAILIGIGVPEARIKTKIVGKDYLRDSDSSDVRAMARRVSIHVLK